VSASVNCATLLQNAEDIEESAAMLIQDNLETQRQIHTRRRQEKKQVDERLKQKLREKSHQHQQPPQQNTREDKRKTSQRLD